MFLAHSCGINMNCLYDFVLHLSAHNVCGSTYETHRGTNSEGSQGSLIITPPMV